MKRAWRAVTTSLRLKGLCQEQQHPLRKEILFHPFYGTAVEGSLPGVCVERISGSSRARAKANLDAPTAAVSVDSGVPMPPRMLVPLAW